MSWEWALYESGRWVLKTVSVFGADCFSRNRVFLQVDKVLEVDCVSL